MLGFLTGLGKAILGNVMQRVVILGPTGSGKTTLGFKVAEKLGLTPVDLDDLHWKPASEGAWQHRTTEEMYALAMAAGAGDKWVIMGNYSKVKDAIWPRADAFIWINYPFYRVFWQLLRRSIARAVDKNPICNGNTESWRLMFSKKSIIVWLFQSYWKLEKRYAEHFAGAGKNPAVRYIRLTSPQATAEFLKSLENPS
jgi:adenylate kinase family enzyme